MKEDTSCQSSQGSSSLSPMEEDACHLSVQSLHKEDASRPSATAEGTSYQLMDKRLVDTLCHRRRNVMVRRSEIKVTENYMLDKVYTVSYELNSHGYVIFLSRQIVSLKTRRFPQASTFIFRRKNVV